ncbi:MAG TPA: SDR family NAD(P)-dependent oxidoreductase, partial [Actinoplanes sp.]
MSARVAVVTGGGSGIGAAAARELAADGWTVVIAGRRADALDEVAAGMDRIDPVPADVTNEAQVRRLFETVVARHRRVDLLFNNAGTSAPAVEL